MIQKVPLQHRERCVKSFSFTFENKRSNLWPLFPGAPYASNWQGSRAGNRTDHRDVRVAGNTTWQRCWNNHEKRIGTHLLIGRHDPIKRREVFWDYSPREVINRNPVLMTGEMFARQQTKM